MGVHHSRALRAVNVCRALTKHRFTRWACGLLAASQYDKLGRVTPPQDLATICGDGVCRTELQRTSLDLSAAIRWSSSQEFAGGRMREEWRRKGRLLCGLGKTIADDRHDRLDPTCP
jgi:hypothetical protein